MDEKVLKIMLPVTILFTILLGIVMSFLPGVRQKEIFAEEQRIKEQMVLKEQSSEQNQPEKQDGMTESEDTEEETASAQEEFVIEKELEDQLDTQTQDPVEETEKNSVSGDVEETPLADAQLTIELPDEVKKSEVVIDNDCLNQKIYVKFPCEEQGYFSRYRVKGSSDGIESMLYYVKDGQGVLTLEVDQIYEPVTTFQSGRLQMDLKQPREVYDKIVVVDAGHGGEKPGTVQGEIYEKDIDLAIVRELKKIADASDENVGLYYTRLEDVNPSLEKRVGLANSLEADLFISIHNNSVARGKDNKLNGTEVLYHASEESGKTSRYFAQICLEEVTAALGSENIGLLKGDDIYIIRHSKMPVALIEVGFMSNPQELTRLNSQKYQEQAAQGIYRAILRAIEEGY